MAVVRKHAIPSSVRCAAARALKSTRGIWEIMAELPSLDRVSATQLLLSSMWWTSVVNSEMYAKCLCCRGDHGWLAFDIAKVKSLWSM